MRRWDGGTIFGNGGDGGGGGAMHRATRAYTLREHLRMWQLRAPCRRRTDGRTGPQPRNAPHVTHMLPAGLSFHVDDDPPAGDVSLQPARPLPRINVRVRTRQHGRAAPVGTELPRFCTAASSSAAADPGSRWLDDHAGHGERHLPVVMFVMRSSARRLPRPWKWRYQVSAQVMLNERTEIDYRC